MNEAHTNDVVTPISSPKDDVPLTTSHSNHTYCVKYNIFIWNAIAIATCSHISATHLVIIYVSESKKTRGLLVRQNFAYFEDAPLPPNKYVQPRDTHMTCTNKGYAVVYETKMCQPFYNEHLRRTLYERFKVRLPDYTYI